ncbi:hypothetical protein [Sphingomonas asaccharolytica]|uniref:hypothetical protein n=1 Tax=Sphingomonas asaccharolytica TaxID=40681 RepID=UPI0008379150|nr:hypothetical protein [Sphingomonas asaccharolytica]
MTDPPSFRAIRHKSLAAAGLGAAGVDASLVGDTLVLRGTGGGQVMIPLASIARLRVGYEQNKYAGNLYRMTVWTSAAPGALTLATIQDDEADYAAIARAIAAAVEHTRGPGAVEGGLGWLVALAGPLWIVSGLAFGTFAVNSEQEGHSSLLADALMMAAIGAPILAIILWFFFRPYRPRRLSGLSDLDRFLPR